MPAGMDAMGGAGQPPLPPTATPAPTFQGLQGAPSAPSNPSGPGASQIGGALTRLGMEIDQALKLLAQAAPQLSQWVDQTTQQLRSQIGMALQSGVPTSPASDQNARFPGGGGNL